MSSQPLRQSTVHFCSFTIFFTNKRASVTLVIFFASSGLAFLLHRGFQGLVSNWFEAGGLLQMRELHRVGFIVTHKISLSANYINALLGKI